VSKLGIIGLAMAFVLLATIRRPGISGRSAQVCIAVGGSICILRLWSTQYHPTSGDVILTLGLALLSMGAMFTLINVVKTMRTGSPKA
jgi:hypothetical protein